MIEKWVDNLLEAAAADGLVSDDDKPVARYGLIVAFHTAATFFTIVVAGYLLGVAPLAVTVALTSALFRFVSGGAHLNDSFRCLVFTTVVFAAAAWVARFVGRLLPQSFVIPVVIVCVISGLLAGMTIVHVYVPVDTAQRPISSAEEKRKFRCLSIVAVLAITGAVTILGLSASTVDYAFAVWFGYCLQLFSLTPAGIRAVNLMNKREKAFH